MHLKRDSYTLVSADTDTAKKSKHGDKNMAAADAVEPKHKTYSLVLILRLSRPVLRHHGGLPGAKRKVGGSTSEIKDGGEKNK